MESDCGFVVDLGELKFKRILEFAWWALALVPLMPDVALLLPAPAFVWLVIH